MPLSLGRTLATCICFLSVSNYLSTSTLHAGATQSVAIDVRFSDWRELNPRVLKLASGFWEWTLATRLLEPPVKPGYTLRLS